jgi:hypothetical protein
MCTLSHPSGMENMFLCKSSKQPKQKQQRMEEVYLTSFEEFLPSCGENVV